MDKFSITESNSLLPIKFETFTFSGGEEHVRIHPPKFHVKEVEINARIQSSSGVMKLMVMTDALAQTFPGVRIGLVLPYLPYARQDRVCSPGDAFSLDMFALMLNTQCYKYVKCWDVHSPIASKLIHNFENVPASSLLYRSQVLNRIILAPDKGAVERAEDVCAKLGGSGVMYAQKTRAPATGEITGMELVNPISTMVGENGNGWNGEFLMVDDICDGGRTFIELAKLLRPLTSRKINLYVTHLIASKGFDVFENIDTIYTANCFHENPPQKVKTL